MKSFFLIFFPFFRDKKCWFKWTCSFFLWIVCNVLVLRKPEERFTWVHIKLELGECYGSSLIIQDSWFLFPLLPFTRQNSVKTFLSRSQLLLGLCPSHNPSPNHMSVLEDLITSLIEVVINNLAQSGLDIKAYYYRRKLSPDPSTWGAVLMNVFISDWLAIMKGTFPLPSYPQ